VRAKWSGWAFGGYRTKRREQLLLDRQRNEMTHGAAVACVAHGADVAASQQRRCEVAAAAAQLSRVRDASVRALFKRLLRLTSGPQNFIYLLRFSNTHISIFKLVTILMSNFHQIFHKDRWKHKEQLSFLAQLHIPQGLQVINFGINSNLIFS
jgi:hypothetical protein